MDKEKIKKHLDEAVKNEKYEIAAKLRDDLERETKPKDLREFSQGLNEGQKKAFDGLVSFLTEKSSDVSILVGYAGTGKTFLVKRLTDYIHKHHPKWKIALTAPTNRAVRVLSKMNTIKDYRCTYQTIHKLLGLKEEIKNDGTIVFTRQFNTTNEIRSFKVLIVDEVSMLDDKLFDEIYKERGFIKIIFMGDPAQIPPVNRPDCIPFNEEKKMFFDFREFRLTQIMRQSEGNPIIESSFTIRNNLTKRNPIDNIQTSIVKNGNGIIRIDLNKKEERDSTYQLFEKYFKTTEFMEDANYAKVIAWRNVTVDKVNRIIRQIIFGDHLDKIVENEKLVVKKPIMDGSTDIIIFNTSEELSVKEFSITTDSFNAVEGKVKLKYYDTIVTAFDIEGKEYDRSIMILHEDSQRDFDIISNAFKKKAIETKGHNGAWNKYYQFTRIFANVAYNYSITCHQSQGGTYQNVFVMEDDIDLNSDIYEKNRILYTSYSRPSDHLFILKR